MLLSPRCSKFIDISNKNCALFCCSEAFHIPLESSKQSHPGTQHYKDEWIPNMDKAIISLAILVLFTSSWIHLMNSNSNFNSAISRG